ncbi:CBS domain-containing protein [Neobacillus sp. C211]|uniref:CBS domain-containing protein n=1 Tax=unclassified Neobacillus TaxID=2675272 RepID=UPI0039798882
MLQIKELITSVDCIVTENTTLVEAISLMNKKKWNLLPVSDVARKLVGVFGRCQNWGRCRTC